MVCRDRTHYTNQKGTAQVSWHKLPCLYIVGDIYVSIHIYIQVYKQFCSHLYTCEYTCEYRCEHFSIEVMGQHVLCCNCTASKIPRASGERSFSSRAPASPSVSDHASVEARYLESPSRIPRVPTSFNSRMQVKSLSF